MHGFELVGVFDKAPEIIGKKIGDLTVTDIEELESFCKEHSPKAAIICIPHAAAAELADKFISLGIVGFWNFSSYDFSYSYDNVSVVNVYLGDSMMTLSYMINHNKMPGAPELDT